MAEPSDAAVRASRSRGAPRAVYRGLVSSPQGEAVAVACHPTPRYRRVSRTSTCRITPATEPGCVKRRLVRRSLVPRRRTPWFSLNSPSSNSPNRGTQAWVGGHRSVKRRLVRCSLVPRCRMPWFSLSSPWLKLTRPRYTDLGGRPPNRERASCPLLASTAASDALVLSQLAELKLTRPRYTGLGGRQPASKGRLARLSLVPRRRRPWFSLNPPDSNSPNRGTQTWVRNPHNTRVWARHQIREGRQGPPTPRWRPTPPPG